MLKKIYDKSKLSFAICWIVAYCALMSVGDSLSAGIGIDRIISLPIALTLSLLLLIFLKKNGLLSEQGICPSAVSAKSMLYYAPVLIMLTANLWFGVSLNYSAAETVIYILTMLCVGFLEEVIFRGLLFNAMKDDSVRWAVIVSSLTFGIGHIINLFNGSGAELIPNLLQVIYATAAGFMFVMIYLKTNSLYICIAAHGFFNAASAFSGESAEAMPAQIVTCVLLALITGGYAVYIALTISKKSKTNKKYLRK